MPDIYINQKRPIVYKAADTAFLFAVGLYIFTMDITKTTMHLELPERKEYYLAVILAITGVFRLAAMLTEDRDNIKRWLGYIVAALAVDAVYVMIYRENHVKMAVFFALLTLGSVGLHYTKVLKAYIIAAATVIFSAIMMSWAGAIENFVYLSGNTSGIRSSWGIKYPTDLMSFLFFLLLAVWVVCREKDDLWFLIPGSILLLMSYCVACSRTGTICYTAFLIAVCIDRIINHRSFPRLSRFVDVCCCAAFPFWTSFIAAVSAAYMRGSALAIRIDLMMTSRIYLALMVLGQYGYSLFGRDIPQRGNGGSTFLKEDYSFVDISYLLIFLQLGIVALILFNILWVAMTYKAVKIGDRRLALMLALIALNGVSEHHVSQIYYNIILAVPFTVITAMSAVPVEYSTKNIPLGTEVRENNRFSIKDWKSITVILAAISLLAVLILASLPSIRTVATLLDLGGSVYKRRLLFAACSIVFWLTVLTLLSIYKLFSDSKNIKTEETILLTGKKLSTAVVFTTVICFIVVAVFCNIVINKGAKPNNTLLNSERKAIEAVENTGRTDLYVEDLPSLYKKNKYKIKSSLFNGEELARFDNAAVLVDKYTDSPVFFGKGFQYTEISDSHALMVKDGETIKALEMEGYRFTSYYPLLLSVDLKELAEKNDAEYRSDGTVVVNGESNAIKNGPGVDLRSGDYTFSFILEDEDKEEAGNSNDAGQWCKICITGNNGKNILSESIIEYNQLDEDRRCLVEIKEDIPDTEDVDFQVIPYSDSSVGVKSISYQKTPAEEG